MQRDRVVLQDGLVTRLHIREGIEEGADTITRDDVLTVLLLHGRDLRAVELQGEGALDGVCCDRVAILQRVELLARRSGRARLVELHLIAQGRRGELPEEVHMEGIGDLPIVVLKEGEVLYDDGICPRVREVDHTRLIVVAILAILSVVDVRLGASAEEAESGQGKRGQ